MATSGEPKQPEEQELSLDDLANKPQPDAKWTREHENILAEWADKANVFRWLHAKAQQHFNTMNMWFTIPVIVMSTLTGTANFATEKIPEDARGYFGMGVGAVNIFAGILTTVAQFLKISELNEAHRVASLSWDKFYRNIKVELAKRPEERSNVITMIKICKEEYDRLSEIAPPIDDVFIQQFSASFSDGVDKIKGPVDEENLSQKAKDYLNLVKPEICNSMKSVRESVYVAPPADAAAAARAGARLKKVLAIKKEQQTADFESKVKSCIVAFKERVGRQPTGDEISRELDMYDKLAEIDAFIKVREQLEDDAADENDVSQTNVVLSMRKRNSAGNLNNV